jgi:twitching motility protein PilT
VETIIQAAVQRGASDLHIKAGDVFRARINGSSSRSPSSG